MPDGQVQWIDTNRDVAHIVRKGREYIAPIAEVDKPARVPGTRVHFDISRSEGVDGAANVTAKKGTRTNRTHRRFADLTGARQPGAKVKSTSSTQLGVDVTTQPMRVAEAWVVAQAEGATDDVLNLYAPDAMIHGEDGNVKGRSHVRAKMADQAACHFDPADVEFTGLDDLIRIDWPATTSFGSENPATAGATSYLLVDHGHIAEHWDRVAPPAEPDEQGDQLLISNIRGELTDAERAYVTEHFDRFRLRIQRPVLFARLKLRVVDDPKREQPVSASSTLDVDGRLIRAFVSAATVTEAIDTLIRRLRTQLDRTFTFEPPTRKSIRTDDWEALVAEARVGGQTERPVEERELVRHKSYTTNEATVEEAAWDMTLLDYDFFLFNELSSGQDCLLAKGTDGLVLYRLDAEVAVASSEICPVELVSASAPDLSVSGAIDRLNDSDEPFVFFRNAATEQGHVAYRRLDGHYGLITPPPS